MSDFYFC